MTWSFSYGWPVLIFGAIAVALSLYLSYRQWRSTNRKPSVLYLELLRLVIILLIFFSLLRHMRQLEAAWQLGASDQGTAAKQLGVHPFTAKKLLDQRRNYDQRRFDKAYRALAVAEPGLRGRAPATLETAAGVNHGDRLVVELALARLLS